MKNRLIIYLVVITGLITIKMVTVAYYECVIIEEEESIWKNEIEVLKIKNKNRIIYGAFTTD